ncbi:MAG: GH32 C-terminal domain-containing protein [Muribaculaceae bacterium]|nr:GH32 C-terminal domain-containing protein [Muribaculaceae bacterium]
MRKTLPILMSFIAASPLFAADLVTNISLNTTDSFKRVTEEISGNKLTVRGYHSPENIPGAVGDALRFDGYSTFIEGEVADFNPTGASSFSLWIAPETYPIVLEDQPSTEKITIAGTINHSAKTGWEFAIDKDGNYSFDCYAGGWLASVEASDKVPCYDWSFLAAVNDPEAGTITLYRNGEQVGQGKSLGPLGNGSSKLTVGKTADSSTSPFGIKTFNGLIDEVNVYNGVLSEAELNATPENMADLTIPESRFEKDLLRPKYHGMPGANWTNESHGMTYSDGKYHVFFQKNANGPYMSRLHWGHITSENLYDWTEEKIALAPGEDYDHKGVWSGAVFTDEEITGGVPNIIYTGVDYARAYIVQAKPTDETLIDWEKQGVIINGKPVGLSDDFRDPYFFRNGDNAYIIVGTAKDGIGATTLHRYNKATKTWSNDGSIFFAGNSKEEDGTFWEMPNITKLADGKWLFTVTPQNTSKGVHTLYWIGDINEDGTFKPSTEKPLDLELVNGQGYGLLSPTIYQKDGKTIMLGIVPDKLPTIDNCNLGWAHLYSFPRELSLNEEGNLIQKPYSGLEELRGTGYSTENLALDGVKTIEKVSGRQVEVRGVFTVGDVPFGFNLLKGAKGYASVTYTPVNNKLEINVTKLNRKVNDQNSFNGRYSATLPEVIEKGSEFILDVYLDGSILDVFVNNKYATSVRLYPTDSDADGVEVFSDGGTVKVNSLNAWVLDSAYSEGNDNPGSDVEDPDAGVDGIIADLPEYVNVYNMNGLLVKRNVKSTEAIAGLPRGIYVIGSHKFTVK